MKSLSDKENTCAEDVPAQAEPVEQTMFLYPLPREVALITLGFLRSNDLKSVALVHRAGRNLASLVRIRRFQQRLADTSIWRCLPTIANDNTGESDKSFITYLRAGLGPRLPVSEAWAANNGTFSAFLSNWVIRFPHTLERLGFGITCYADIQAKVQSLMQLVCSNEKDGRFLSCTHLSECMDLADESLKITAWQKYDELDQIFSCLVLFIAISRMPATNNSVWLIMMSPLNRGLTGPGLMALESCFPEIFPGLIREAIRIHKLEQRTDEDNQRISAIESLLARLSEIDLLNYIESEQIPQPFPLALPIQRQIFIEVLEAKYEFMIERLSLAVLLKIEVPKNNSHLMSQFLAIPYVLKSTFILERIKSEGLLAILKVRENLDVAKVINDHPNIYPFITVEVIIDLVNSTKLPGDMIVVFLTQPKILAKLDQNQIVTFAKYLVYDKFDDVLASQAFQDKLSQDPQRNELIMKLAKTEGNCSLAQSLAKNPYTASLLTIDEIVWLIENSVAVHGPFADNEALMNRLNSAQLLNFIKATSHREWLMAPGRLQKFTNDDLIVLVSHATRRISIPAFLEYAHQLILALPNELIRRAVSGGPDGQKLTSTHWFSLACSHTELGLFITRHYLDQLWANDLTRLSSFYWAKDVELLQKSDDSSWPYQSGPEVDSSVDCESNYQLIIERVNTALLSKVTVVPYHLYDKAPSKRSTAPDHLAPTPIKSFTNPTNVKNSGGAPWYNTLIKILLILALIISIALMISGIGSAMGLTGASVVTDFLFASLPFSSSLASCLVGLLVYGVFTAFWLALDSYNEFAPENDLPTTADSKKSKYSLEPLAGNILSKEKQNQLRSQANVSHLKSETDENAEYRFHGPQ